MPHDLFPPSPTSRVLRPAAVLSVRGPHVQTYSREWPTKHRLCNRDLFSEPATRRFKTHLQRRYLIWGFPKIWVPQVIIHFSGIFHYKPSIWGYPHGHGNLLKWSLIIHDHSTSRRLQRTSLAPSPGRAQLLHLQPGPRLAQPRHGADQEAVAAAFVAFERGKMAMKSYGKWWENDWRRTGKWWEKDGKMMWTWWENNGKTMGKQWENNGKIMGKSWENHGKIHGKPYHQPSFLGELSHKCWDKPARNVRISPIAFLKLMVCHVPFILCSICGRIDMNCRVGVEGFSRIF